jgi:hypothetical protein
MVKATTDNSAASVANNDNTTMQGFNVTSTVVEEAIAAEDSHIKYPEFILKLMNNVRAQPDNTTLQQEYKLSNVKLILNMLIFLIFATLKTETALIEACAMYAMQRYHSSILHVKQIQL